MLYGISDDVSALIFLFHSLILGKDALMIGESVQGEQCMMIPMVGFGNSGYAYF